VLRSLARRATFDIVLPIALPIRARVQGPPFRLESDRLRIYRKLSPPLKRATCADARTELKEDATKWPEKFEDIDQLKDDQEKGRSPRRSRISVSSSSRWTRSTGARSRRRPIVVRLEKQKDGSWTETELSVIVLV